MKVTMFLAADYANISNDGKLNVVGIFRYINAGAFPARHSSMHIVLNLVPELGEDARTRELAIKLLDAEGNDLLTVNGHVEMPRFTGPGTQEVNAILEIKDLVFSAPGSYVFVLLIDRDNKAELELQVNQIKPADADSE